MAITAAVIEPWSPRASGTIRATRIPASATGSPRTPRQADDGVQPALPRR
jgi:hypothetical protein